MNSIPRITREQFALWKHHPVTQTVYKFLESYRELVKQEHLERWEQGVQDPQLESRAVGVIIFCNSFFALEYDALEAAYGDKEEVDE